MRLTENETLIHSTSIDADLKDISEIRRSTFFTSNIYLFRFDKIDPNVLKTWLYSSTKEYLTHDLSQPRISTVFPLSSSKLPAEVPSTVAYSHLVIRDLDLPRNHESKTDSNTTNDARIVSYAVYSYHPPNHVSKFTQRQNTVPDGANIPLCRYWGSQLDSIMTETFEKLPCFCLEAMFTLSPSHLRKGAAKKLIGWITPYSDKYGLPVILVASPLGSRTYQSVGFEEVNEITIDMQDWGWDERVKSGTAIDEGRGSLHWHKFMLRWPKDLDKLDEGWKQWRRKRGIE